MFGLSLIQERLAFAGVLVLVVVGFAWHERYVGGQKCLQNVEKANVVAEQKEAKQHTADQVTVKKEAETYEITVKSPLATPAPVIGLCPKLRRPAVQATAAAGPSADAGPPSGGGDTPSPTLWDTTPIVTAGRNANAQIRGLQHYITDVCRPAP